ncbi:MAG: terpene utilization protein AtuA [Candidatus Hydrogenedentota bacterium]|nr:MAG: terpene utilization protein AtuA [Candidatus Hydrogenedentota bacterium]
MSDKTINIGGASGFWGDSNIAAPQLLASGKLDYLVFDYLAEITMSILARAREKNADHGYALDFVTTILKQHLNTIADQGIKVISNAGGVNPEACGRAIEALVAELGLDLKVATITGDDLIDQAAALRAAHSKEMFTGESMPEKFMSINAYLGGFPVARALDKGADIVVTGRCVDSAVTLGACIHAFGWKEDDYDQLASGSLAGHIIECGAQASGGLFTDWQETGPWENIGYPIAEVSADGSFVVFKPDGTGGLVDHRTVAEQLIYEIGDPQAYILPDVVCDFSGVIIEDIGKDRAKVSGTKGLQPTDTCKVSATYRDGFRIGQYVSIRGIDAKGKAQKTADAVVKRTNSMLEKLGAPGYTEISIEILGAEAGYGPHSRIDNPREVILKLAAKHPSADALMLMLRELTSSGTSMSPGTSGMGGNRPKPSPVVRLFSMLVPKESVTAVLHFGGESEVIPWASGEKLDLSTIDRPVIADEPAPSEPTVDVPLIAIAHGRSGDKGNDSNIGIIARKPEYYHIIRRELTAGKVKDYFDYLMDGGLERFDLPGINSVNFLMHDSLGGGGIASLRNDPQAKAYAQILLDIPIAVPKSLAEKLYV